MSVMPMMTEAAMPHARRPAKAMKPQAMTASTATAVEIGPVKAVTSVVSVDCTGCKAPPPASAEVAYPKAPIAQVAPGQLRRIVNSPKVIRQSPIPHA